jgi:hypothetical protein
LTAGLCAFAIIAKSWGQAGTWGSSVLCARDPQKLANMERDILLNGTGTDSFKNIKKSLMTVTVTNQPLM